MANQTIPSFTFIQTEERTNRKRVMEISRTGGIARKLRVSSFHEAKDWVGIIKGFAENGYPEGVKNGLETVFLKYGG